MATPEATELKHYDAMHACFTDLSSSGNSIHRFFEKNVLSGTVIGKLNPDHDFIYGRAQVEGAQAPFGLAMYLLHGVPEQVFFSRHFESNEGETNPSPDDYTVIITRIGDKLSAETCGKPLHINEPFDAWVVRKLADLSTVIRGYRIPEE